MIPYLIIISVIAAVITVYDKYAAKTGKYRIPEDALLLVSVLGGSAAMYAAMKLIRHKTRHKRFMIGIPVIIILQITLFAVFLYLKNPGLL